MNKIVQSQFKLMNHAELNSISLVSWIFVPWEQEVALFKSGKQRFIYFQSAS
jgi:hypothetical protein